MLSRLWTWARSAKPAEARPAPAPPPLPKAPQVVAKAPSKPEPTFFEELAAELPALEPLREEDEQAIAELVLQVVTFVTQKKLDPPVVPALVPRVLEITGEPEVDLQRLTHVIQQDLSISAKLLSVANSPMFGSGIEVKTVRHAISQLGSEQVAQVAIGLACRSNMESAAKGPSPFAARWTRQFQHGMTCALAAAHLAGKQDRGAQEACFLGGLFHDVGKAVALRAIESLTSMGKLAMPSDTTNDEALHRIHAYPGDEFYQKWTLPEPLMELCAQHHQLEDVQTAPRAFYLVTLASGFDSLVSGAPASRREALEETRLSGERLGLSDSAMRAAYSETRALGEKASRMFGS